MRTSQIMAVSLPKKLARAVHQKSKRSGLGRSEIMRAALVRYLRDEASEFALMKELERRALGMGLRSEDDVEMLIDSMRS